MTKLTHKMLGDKVIFKIEIEPTNKVRDWCIAVASKVNCGRCFDVPIIAKITEYPYNVQYFISWLHKKEMNDREKLIGNIYTSLNPLDVINIGLDCKVIDNTGHINRTMGFFNYIGITDILYGNNQFIIKRFVDRHDILQYFPGYIRNKEKWDYLKENNMKLNSKQLGSILTGRINPLDWKNLTNGGW